MAVQVFSRSLSYFSCLPNRHMSSFMSILGQGINHSSIHNLPSANTHIPFSVIHAFNNLLFSQCIYIYIYIYIIKRARESNKSFSPLCFVPSWNPHHRCGFSCSQPLSLHRECWTNPSWSWHLVSPVYFRPLNHGSSLHGLSQLLGPSLSYYHLFHYCSFWALQDSRMSTCIPRMLS